MAHDESAVSVDKKNSHTVAYRDVLGIDAEAFGDVAKIELIGFGAAVDDSQYKAVGVLEVERHGYGGHDGGSPPYFHGGSAGVGAAVVVSHYAGHGVGGIRLVVGGGVVGGVGPFAELRSVVSPEAVLELVLWHRILDNGVENGRHTAGDVVFALFKAHGRIGVFDDELGSDSLRLGVGEQHVLNCQRHVVGAGLEVVGSKEVAKEGREVRSVLVAGPGVCESFAKRAFRSEGDVLAFLDDIGAVCVGNEFRRAGIAHGRAVDSLRFGVGVFAFRPVEVELAAFYVGIGPA